MIKLIPSKRIREEFCLTYELEGAQKAVNFLSKYYKIKRMKIILDGRRVGGKYFAYYFENKAFFKKRGLTKRIVLHEFYHHLVFNGKIIPKREELEAENYAKTIIRARCRTHSAL